MRIGLIAGFYIALVSTCVVAQNLDLNQNLPDVNWKKLKSRNFIIIFPEKLDSEAMRVANIMEYIREPLQGSHGTHMSHWPIILSNGTAEANGYVTVAPKRSEWYSVPPQSSLIGTGEWYSLLATHEGKHMAQSDRFLDGFTLAAYYFFGETAWSVLQNISVPMWYFEGDAVTSECALSNTGRGRMPEFTMGVRALELSDVRYKYSKAYLGSYKHYFPDHYTLGYLMTSYIKRDIGYVKMNRLNNDLTGKSYSPFYYSRLLKRYSKSNIRKTYNLTLDEARNRWKAQESGFVYDKPALYPENQPEFWTNYMYPADFKEKEVIAVKNGMDNPVQLVSVNTETNEEVVIAQISAYERASYANSKVVWNDYSSHYRYTNVSYSDVVMMDINTKRQTRLTKHGRYYSPALSKDASLVVAVEYTAERKCNLVIINTTDKMIVRTIPTPDGSTVQFPSWSEDATKIVYTIQRTSGKAIEICDLESGSTSTIVPEGSENVSTPVFRGKYVIYQSDYSGINNIYAIDTVSHKHFQIVSSRFGAFNPQVTSDGAYLIYNDYSIHGNKIAKLRINEGKWTKKEHVLVQHETFLDTAIINAESLGKSVYDKAIPKEVFSISRYGGLGRTLKIHSWGIAPDESSNLKVFITSNNLLNTAAVSGGFLYNNKLKEPGYFLQMQYAKHYPVFELMGSRRFRLDENTSPPYDTAQTVSWSEDQVGLSVTLPYLKSEGLHSTSFSFKTGFKYANVSYMRKEVPFYSSNGTYFPVFYQAEFQRLKRGAYRDINPPFAQHAVISYTHTPVFSNGNGDMLFAHAKAYFPGLFKHHSFSVQASYEKHGSTDYWVMPAYDMIRGYNFRYYTEFANASALYEFPLFHPDINFGKLLYIKRIRGGVFVDAGSVNYEKKEVLSSAGSEITIDFVPFSLMFLNLNVGMRQAFRFNDQKIATQLMFLGITL